MLLAGCGQLSPRMQADTPEHLYKSVRKYMASGQGLSGEERTELANGVLDLYLTEDRKAWKEPAPGTLPVELFDQIRQADFPVMARRALNQPSEDDKLFAVQPRKADDPLTLYWVNDFYVKQLKAQEGILLTRKEQSRQADLFTIDQLAFADAAFIPPQDGQPLSQDFARFTVRMLNNTQFNLYKPSFRVVVKDPRRKFPILDLVLTHTSDEPFAPGEVARVDLQCCDGYRFERVNHLLRTLPSDASTGMHLVGVEDYRKRNVIEKIIFTSDEHLKLLATQRCIKEVEADMAAWTPAKGTGVCEDT